MAKKWLASLLAAVLLPLIPAVPAAATPAGAMNLGVYHWDRQPGQITDFSEWIGKDAYLAEDFLLNQTWAQLEGADRLSYWQNTPWQNKMVWAAYPFPNGQGNLKDAAAGNYNAHYYQLGANLVNAGMDNAVIRFGHEFNGNWYDYSVFKDPDGVAAGEARFAASFRQFVTTMKTVPGQHFTFVWNPTVNIWGVDLANAYPGDAYVDVVGIDIYDQSWDNDTYPYPVNATPAERLRRQQNAWNANLYNNNWGLKMIGDLADLHNKPIAIAEWGIADRADGNGGGDDAYFVQQMYDWMSAHNVIWNVYFNVAAGDGNHDLYDTHLFPEASAKFQQLWNTTGAATSPRAPVPAATYPAGTVFKEAEDGVYTQPSGTQARPYGSPWATGKEEAALLLAGAAVSYPNAPAAGSLMVRYQAPQNGDIYVSVYVDDVLKASHVKLTSVNRTEQTTYRVATLPVAVPAGGTLKFRIDPNDDQTVNGVWDSVLLDQIGFVPGGGNPPSSGGNTHSGSWAAKGEVGGSGNWKYMTQWHAIDANTNYTASVWVKGTGKVSLRALDGQWNPIAAQTATAGSQWTQVSLSFNSGSRTLAGFELIDDTGSPGTLYLDDAYLGIGAGGTNLLDNPGFESGNNYQWGGDWGSVFSLIEEIPQSNVHGGSWAAKAALGSPGNWSYMIQWPSVAPNTVYTASVWVKGAGTFSLRALDDSWNPIASQAITATGAWTQASLTFNSGNRTFVGFELIDNLGGSGTVYIDDAYLGIGASGANGLANPGFESGNNNQWGGDWGTVFAIVQP